MGSYQGPPFYSFHQIPSQTCPGCFLWISLCECGTVERQESQLPATVNAWDVDWRDAAMNDPLYFTNGDFLPARQETPAAFNDEGFQDWTAAPTAQQPEPAIFPSLFDEPSGAGAEPELALPAVTMDWIVDLPGFDGVDGQQQQPEPQPGNFEELLQVALQDFSQEAAAPVPVPVPPPAPVPVLAPVPAPAAQPAPPQQKKRGRPLGSLDSKPRRKPWEPKPRKNPRPGRPKGVMDSKDCPRAQRKKQRG